MAKKLYDIAVKSYIEKLAERGQYIVDRELASISYKHDTYNLHDSYGWCVYVNGKIARMGFAGSEKATEAKKWKGTEYWGRDAIKNLFEHRYKPTSYIELAIGVAMPYGMYLEENLLFEVFAVANDATKSVANILKAKHEYIRLKN